MTISYIIKKLKEFRSENGDVHIWMIVNRNNLTISGKPLYKKED